ncbi:DUF4097 family beta strand repeat-containing protein [Paenibacillus segetis]|uniref:DUF4097 domain-containing protein n=1 Tax=Paenibacillus segetis TaxID=1325360 RepID=A0ABQ1YNA9_9BACL|nr:DUF4097 family beta strand repeat-containing protein [Paenibacillus segetis]GGH30968.1 hypothetical protein GCM10008013_34410 [Paenibacillus segetis]
MKNLMKFVLVLSLSAVTLFYTGGGDTGTASARSLADLDLNFDLGPDFDFDLKLDSSDLQQVDNIGTGITIDKGTTRMKVGDKTKTISVMNQNGTIEFKQGSVKDVEVQTKVVVQNATKEEAKVVADKVKLQVKEGTTLDIKTSSEPYGRSNMYRPSIHLTITLPQTMKSDLNAALTNGNISLSKLTSIGKIKLTSENGNLTAKGVSNDISLQTTNGVVQVSDAKKSVRAKVTNGNIAANRISGALHMETTNGNLSSDGAVSSIKAVTMAGNINIKSSKIGGDWDVSSTVGNVYLAWPEKAAVEVDGTTSFGVIETDLPLTVKKNHVTGKIGSGSYQIHASSMAGLSLMKN